MKYSVVIPVYNEDPDVLINTVSNVFASDPKPHEVIVVDDRSEQPVAPLLSSFPEVKLIVTDERSGAGPAKRIGGMAATGDSIVLVDAHMRLPFDWLAYVERAQSLYPDSLLCPVCRGFKVDTKHMACGAGFSRNKDNLFLGRYWWSRGDVDTIDRCPCLLGACYVIPMHVWVALDGINPNLYGWGYGEQDLSVRAYLYGWDVRRINNLVTAHRFGRPSHGSDGLNAWHGQFNAWVTAATLFDEGVFERLFKPYFKQAFSPRCEERFDVEYENIMAFREKVQSHKVFRDDELDTLLEWRLPTPREQKMRVDYIHARRSEQNA